MRLRSLVGLLVAAMVLGGCSKGASSTAPRPDARAGTAASSAGRTRALPQRAPVWLLRWRVAGLQPGGVSSLIPPSAYASCASGPIKAKASTEFSPLLVQPTALETGQLWAEIEMFPSRADARQLGRAYLGQSVTSCLATATKVGLGPLVNRSQVTLSSDVVVVPLVPPVTAEDAFEYRMAARATPGNDTDGSYPIFVDFVGFVSGRLFAEMEFSSVYGLFPAGLEQKAVHALADRIGIRAP